MVLLSLCVGQIGQQLQQRTTGVGFSPAESGKALTPVLVPFQKIIFCHKTRVMPHLFRQPAQMLQLLRIDARYRLVLQQLHK